MNLQKMLSGFQEVISNFDIETENILKGMKQFILDANRDQLLAGTTADDKLIGDLPPFYNTKYFPDYENYRKKLGLQTNHIDLKINGLLHDSLLLEVSKGEISILSDDDPEKVHELIHGGTGQKIKGQWSVRQGGFGENIFGLNTENKQKRNDILRGKLLDYIAATVNK